jgi:hypothetical protein
MTAVHGDARSEEETFTSAEQSRRVFDKTSIRVIRPPSSIQRVSNERLTKGRPLQSTAERRRWRAEQVALLCGRKVMSEKVASTSGAHLAD